MRASFTDRERQRLVEGLAGGDRLVCPACGAELSRSVVAPPDGVAYVRRRVWLVCPGCKRSGAVDVPRGPATGGGPP